ncbi:hypothetical protein BD560DRAFT_119533 [Blakeslea trispora]|nr:hypothetical protein BD560DRAFT_119533 [Blakeslea trispora]
MNGLDYDLHSRILVSLASVLADSRAKTTTDEVAQLLSKCPEIPLVDMTDLNIVTSLQDEHRIELVSKSCFSNEKKTIDHSPVL